MTTIAGKRVLNLGDVQETMLIPLHARAVETGKRHPILRDSAAVDIVRAIDDDFRRFGERPSALATYIALRTAVFDEWVGRASAMPERWAMSSGTMSIGLA